MKILVIGDGSHLEECRQKFGKTHECLLNETHLEARKSFRVAEVVFDFIIEEDPSQLLSYKDCTVPVFLNTVMTTLSEIVGPLEQPSTTFFGFNGLPSFFNRTILEVSVRNDDDHATLSAICASLGTPFEIVADRPGMVTPRVVCMIINEAFRTVEDGTATREDIDAAMKFGTNYPFGPFEWAEKIGLKNVYELLEAMRRVTNDERYEVCKLLEAESRR